jgi:hypothetical protein
MAIRVKCVIQLLWNERLYVKTDILGLDRDSS